MHARAHRNLFFRLFSMAAICAAYILWAAAFIYKWKQDGSLVSVRNAADNLPTLFQQNVITVLIPILLSLIFLVRLKKAFTREMYFGITGKMQIMFIALLCCALAGITFYCFAAKQNKVTILYHLLYYVVFIALTEEFVIRGVCAYLVSDYSWHMRYLAPNFCFAIMHIFSYADWEPDTWVYSAICFLGFAGLNGSRLLLLAAERKIRHPLDSCFDPCAA